MNTLVTIMAICLLAAIAISFCVRAVYRKRNTKLMANAANQPGTGQSLTGYKTFVTNAAASFATFATTYTVPAGAIAGSQIYPAGRYALVKLTAAGVVDVSAATTDVIVGVMLDNQDSTDYPTGGDPVNVRLMNAPGTALMVAAGVIAVGAQVCSNGDGAAKAWVTGSNNPIIGQCLNGAGAAGDIIEVVTKNPIVTS